MGGCRRATLLAGLELITPAAVQDRDAVRPLIDFLDSQLAHPPVWKALSKDTEAALKVLTVRSRPSFFSAFAIILSTTWLIVGAIR